MNSRQLAQQHFPEIIDFAAQLQAMSHEDIAVLAASMGLTYCFTTFVLKNLLIWVLRLFGLYSPKMYGEFISTLPLWKSIYRGYIKYKRWKEFLKGNQKSENASFANTASVLTQEYDKSKILLGRPYFAGIGLNNPVGLAIQKHLYVVASSGSGKTTWMITMLSLWNGSVGLVDPKGQVTDTLADKDHREWVVLNPYAPDKTSYWNPIDTIKEMMVIEGEDSAVKWAFRLAQSLIVTPSGSKSPFFTEASKGYMVAVVLHVISAHPEEHHNLGYVRELLVHGYRVYNDDGSLESTPEEARTLLDNALLKNPAFNGAVASSGAAFINASGDTKGSLVATIQEQTKWLDIPSVKHMLHKTTRSLSEAKIRNDVVFSFVTPVMSLREELQPLLRLFTNFTTYSFEAVKRKNGQCLFIIDEVQAMGYNQTLEVALPVARSYGLSIVAIAQDIEGMKASYPKTYGSFEGNADAVIYMATNHPMTLNHISEQLGKFTYTEKDTNTGKVNNRWTASVSTPDQVRRFLAPNSNNMIVFKAGGRPMRLKNTPYYHELSVTRYKADSDHNEPLPKRFTRLVIGLMTLKF